MCEAARFAWGWLLWLWLLWLWLLRGESKVKSFFVGFAQYFLGFAQHIFGSKQTSFVESCSIYIFIFNIVKGCLQTSVLSLHYSTKLPQHNLINNPHSVVLNNKLGGYSYTSSKITFDCFDLCLFLTRWLALLLYHFSSLFIVLASILSTIKFY